MITIAGVAVFFVNLFWSLAAGKKAPANPWGEGATTLEWTLSSPPPFHQYLDAAADRLGIGGALPRRRSSLLKWLRLPLARSRNVRLRTLVPVNVMGFPSNTCDRDLTDIFTIQDEISKAIVAALKLKLLPEERKAIEQRRTSNARGLQPVPAGPAILDDRQSRRPSPRRAGDAHLQPRRRDRPVLCRCLGVARPRADRAFDTISAETWTMALPLPMPPFRSIRTFRRRGCRSSSGTCSAETMRRRPPKWKRRCGWAPNPGK